MTVQSDRYSHLLSILDAQTAIAQAALGPTQLMRLVAQRAQALTGASGSAIAVVEGDSLHYVAGSGCVAALDLRVPIARSLSGLSLRSGEVLVSRDAYRDTRLDVAHVPTNVRSGSVAPLTFAGSSVGVLSVVSEHVNAFGEHETSTLKLLAGLVGAALSHAYASEERARAQAETHALNQRLSTVLRAVTEVAIIGVDLTGAITFFGEGAERMLGYRADEVVGQLPVLFHDPVEVRRGLETVGGSAPELFIGPALQGKPHTRDWWYIRKDGSRLLASVTITPMRDALDNVVGFIGVAADVTERRSIERMKDEFISIVSHELRTPLAAVRGSLGLLASGLVATIPTDAQRMFDVALNNTERLVQLVSNMLDLDRINAGAVQLQLATHDLGTLMVQANDVILPSATKAGVQIRTAPLHVNVEVDAERIIQVVKHLVSNAIKFSPPGMTIDIDARCSGVNRVVLAVRDRGPGIPSDELEQIFERFHQVDSTDARAKGGSGLGLTISRLIVEQHGGRIWAQNASDGGTVVSVELPLGGPTRTS